MVEESATFNRRLQLHAWKEGIKVRSMTRTLHLEQVLYFAST
jgi:hypothetical protein